MKTHCWTGIVPRYSCVLPAAADETIPLIRPVGSESMLAACADSPTWDSVCGYRRKCCFRAGAYSCRISRAASKRLTALFVFAGRRVFTLRRHLDPIALAKAHTLCARRRRRPVVLRIGEDSTRYSRVRDESSLSALRLLTIRGKPHRG